MASTSKCPFCNGVVRSDEKTCPNCGGANENYVAEKPRTIFLPKTIDELKEYCAERGMPLLRMRFFIGENYKEPKAFGIYQAEEHRFVVYKNKADGSRSVRYDGPDEAYAVKELFSKLLDECHHRGIYPDSAFQGSVRSAGSGGGYVMKRMDQEEEDRRRAAEHAARIARDKARQRRKKWASLGILFLFALMVAFVIIQNKKQTDRQIKEFYLNPGTYSSKQIASKYYTYNVHTGEIVVSDHFNDHLNDGYYQSDDRIYWNGEYVREVNYWDWLTEEEKLHVQNEGIYHRDDDVWYVFLEEFKDWKRSFAYPDFAGQEPYLGDTWRAEWGVSDFSKALIKSGYYTSETACCYRDYYGNWYIYKSELDDWETCKNPEFQGISLNELEKYTGWDSPPSVKSFEQSTIYALKNSITGYYQQGENIYFHCQSNTLSSTKKSYPSWYKFYPNSGGWKSHVKPSRQSENDPEIKYLGEDPMDEAWYSDHGITNFRLTATWAELNSVTGYYRQKDKVYYHYKDHWYSYDNDRGWRTDFSPATDSDSETFVGSSYETNWNEDWNVSSFTESSIWSTIQAEENRQAQRDRDHSSSSYDSDWGSDYDSWDSSDTDWDSDW